jgi:LysM repeat protein
VHVIAREDMTMDARGGVVGGTPDLNGRNSALEATFQPLRVEVGDTMSIGAAEYDTYGVSARLVGSAQFLQEIGYVPGLINFNEWNVGGALDEKFVSGTTIDMTHFQALGQDTLGRNRGEALMASLYPTHNAMSDVTYALGQPQPVPAVWAVGESTDTGNEFLEKPVEPEPVVEEEVVEEVQPVVKDKHEVRTGDTLWEISREHFGDPYRWPEIWRRTPDIRNPDLIYPGQEIRLEPEAEAVPQ